MIHHRVGVVELILCCFLTLIRRDRFPSQHPSCLQDAPTAKCFTSLIIIQAASNCAVAQEGSDLLGLGPVEENQVLSTDIFEVHLGGVELLGQVEDRVLHEAAALSPVLEFNVHFDGKAFTIIGL